MRSGITELAEKKRPGSGAGVLLNEVVSNIIQTNLSLDELYPYPGL